jgi:hypothetical protein
MTLIKAASGLVGRHNYRALDPGIYLWYGECVFQLEASKSPYLILFG